LLEIAAMKNKPIHVVGAGLAGSSAAWEIARHGVDVILYEMRPCVQTPAHNTDGCAELVCSNSFRSDDHEHNAVGLLHEEMRRLDSLIMREAHKAAVPAGGALAMDRDIFSAGVTKALEEHPRITIKREEVSTIPPAEWDNVIIATGPLTSEKLANAIKDLTGEEELSFFDAIAPIVHAYSINMDIAWKQSRYDKSSDPSRAAATGESGKDYINCPMTEEQYYNFVEELKNAEYGLFKEWELPSGSPSLEEQEQDTPYFDGCMPIEIIAARGKDTLAYGPMKPVGLTNPHVGPDEQPFAVVQLRQDNALGTLYNMVGFQTKMKWGEQTRVFKTIPGLEDASFARLGGLHRNTFINSPKLLDKTLRLKHPRYRHCEEQSEAASADTPTSSPDLIGGSPATKAPDLPVKPEDDTIEHKPTIRFAGQITGCEGYVESAAVGMMTGRFAAYEALGKEPDLPPAETAFGALLGHITGGADAETFQPMNINFGLFPPLSKDEITFINEKGKRRKLKGMHKKKAVTTRALKALDAWLGEAQEKAA